MLPKGITQVGRSGVRSSTDATSSLTARIRVSSACRCRISASFITCTCLHWRPGSLLSFLEQFAFSRGSLRRSRRSFFAILYVPSARFYSGGVHLLSHLRRHNVPSSVYRDLALSSHAPSAPGRHHRAFDCKPIGDDGRSHLFLLRNSL